MMLQKAEEIMHNNQNKKNQNKKTNKKTEQETMKDRSRKSHKGNETAKKETAKSYLSTEEENLTGLRIRNTEEHD